MSETKADSLKYYEIKDLAIASLEGVSPTPVRKRGYHRALKRGENWALIQQMTRHIVDEQIMEMYRHSANEFEQRLFCGLLDAIEDGKE